MPLDLPTFAAKVVRVREMFQQTKLDISKSTGIPVERLEQLEAALAVPTGDEVLILADHFKVNFKYYISNESSLSVDRVEKLFRAHSDDLSSEDRIAIQEFLSLCENETFLVNQLGVGHSMPFAYEKRGTFYKGHGHDAAAKLRRELGYGKTEVPDIFGDIRKLGFRVFRRRLQNPNISGLFISDEVAGNCVLVNYNEDVFRQRFTAAHEAAHGIFDRDDGFVVSFTRWNSQDLIEIRADAFAGAYLAPSELLAELGSAWTPESIVERAQRLQVNPAVLVIALRREGYLTQAQADSLRDLRVPSSQKIDPELPPSLAPKSRARKEALLQRGLSTYYVDLCIRAIDAQIVSKARAAEMLLVNEAELNELLALFGVGEG